MQDPAPAKNFDLPLEIDPASVKTLMDEAANFVLIDCREPDERTICQIEPSILVPFSEISQRLSELESWSDQRMVVHCHGGIRSLQVVRWLRGCGFQGAQSMAGGIDAWSVSVDRSVPRY